MEDRVVKVSYETWKQIKANAFYNCSTTKAMVDDMVKRNRDPQTGKTIE